MNEEKFYGNYNAYVIDDRDPTRSGKVKIFCPVVHSHLEELVQSASIIDENDGKFGGLTEDQLERLRNHSPWGLIAQPLIAVGGGGYDTGGSSLNTGDGFSSAGVGSITIRDFALNTDGTGAQTATGQAQTATGISNRDSVILGYTIPLAEEAFSPNPNRPRFVSKNGIRVRQPAIITFTKSGRSFSLLAVANDTGGRNVKRGQGGKYIGNRSITRDWGELGINTWGVVKSQGMINDFGTRGGGFLDVGTGLVANYEFLEGTISNQSQYRALESQLISEGRLGLNASPITQTQKPAQSLASVVSSEGMNESDDGVVGEPTNPEMSGSYAQFINSLGLRNIPTDQIINYHNRTRGSVSNSFPPREIWDNIIPTLRVLDQVAPQLGGIKSINSVYRSPSYNTAVGGARRSQHLEHSALDVTFNVDTTRAFDVICDFRGNGGFFGGVGWYSGFVHIDTRGNNATWGRSGCAGDGSSGDNVQCDAFSVAGSTNKGEIRDTQIFKEYRIDPTTGVAKQILDNSKDKGVLLRRMSTEGRVEDKETLRTQIGSMEIALAELWGQLESELDGFDEVRVRMINMMVGDADYIQQPSNNQINTNSKNYNSQPFSNKPNGSFSIPKVGSRVFIFFEGGNPDFPVVFANNPTPEAYQSIYNINSPTSDYPDEDSDSKNATRVGSRGGGFSITDTEGREGFKIDSFRGDQIHFHQNGTSRFATGSDNLLVKGDQFNTVRGNHNTHVDGDSDNIYHGDVDYKYGNVRENYKATEKIKNLIKPLHEITALFDRKRADGGDSLSQSPLQTKEGTHVECPHCGDNGSQIVVNSNALGRFSDARAIGNGTEHRIESTDGSTISRPIDKSECLNCNGTGLSQSSREGVYPLDPIKFGSVDPVSACLESIERQREWLETCTVPVPNSVHECQHEETRVMTHLDDKGREVRIEQKILSDKYDALKALGLGSKTAS